MWLPGAPNFTMNFHFSHFYVPHLTAFYSSVITDHGQWIFGYVLKSSVFFSFSESFSFVKAYVTSIVPLWVHITIWPTLGIDLVFGKLDNVLVNVILRVTYLYFLNITCEWWVLLFLSSFYAPFLTNQTFHKVELAAGECLWLRGKHSSCTHQCDAHCRLPAEHPLIVSLQSSESASLWPSRWPFYPLEILGRSDNPWLCSASYKLMHSVLRV